MILMRDTTAARCWGERGLLVQQPILAEPDADIAYTGFEMDVAGPAQNGRLHDAVNQSDNRRLLGLRHQIVGGSVAVFVRAADLIHDRLHPLLPRKHLADGLFQIHFEREMGNDALLQSGAQIVHQGQVERFHHRHANGVFFAAKGQRHLLTDVGFGQQAGHIEGKGCIGEFDERVRGEFAQIGAERGRRQDFQCRERLAQKHALPLLIGQCLLELRHVDQPVGHKALTQTHRFSDCGSFQHAAFPFQQSTHEQSEHQAIKKRGFRNRNREEQFLCADHAARFARIKTVPYISSTNPASL